jgi:hypothetical protein
METENRLRLQASKKLIVDGNLMKTSAFRDHDVSPNVQQELTHQVISGKFITIRLKRNCRLHWVTGEFSKSGLRKMASRNSSVITSQLPACWSETRVDSEEQGTSARSGLWTGENY